MKIFNTHKYSFLLHITKYSFVILCILSLFVNDAFAVNGITAGIDNPLNDSIKDIPSFIKLILQTVLYVAIPIIALAIIYSGYLFVTAQGNEEKLTTAKKTLLYTLVGAALLLGSVVIANAIKGTVDEIKRTS